MVHSSPSRSLLCLVRSFKQLSAADPLTQSLAPRITHSLATQSQLSISDLAKEIEVDLDPTRIGGPNTTKSPAQGITTSTSLAEVYTLEHPVIATRHTWPRIEPSGFALYNAKYMDAPLRKDILHRAVIYEADMTRQGTASTKWRFDVHGSNRKLHAQKGTGRARVRDKKSPIRRGGGVAFGPKPRDFSTELPAKIYQQAFRVALSYRLRRNELIILDNEIDLPQDNTARFLNNIFEANQWGAGHGRSLLVTETLEESNPRLFEVMGTVGDHAELKDIEDVDVKDLLTNGRVVIERSALLKVLCKIGVVDSGGTFFPSKHCQRHNDQAEKVVQYL